MGSYNGNLDAERMAKVGMIDIMISTVFKPDHLQCKNNASYPLGKILGGKEMAANQNFRKHQEGGEPLTLCFHILPTSCHEENMVRLGEALQFTPETVIKTASFTIKNTRTNE